MSDPTQFLAQKVTIANGSSNDGQDEEKQGSQLQAARRERCGIDAMREHWKSASAHVMQLQLSDFKILALSELREDNKYSIAEHTNVLLNYCFFT
jgi:hypothetical protein